MAKRTKSLGRKSEELAVAFLRKNGYRILERNYSCRSGEIDVVACEGDTICFVEVKSRRSEDYGAPETGVTRSKMRRITNVALCYLTQKRVQDADCRFDVVSVLMKESKPEIELFRGAFYPEIQLP